MLRNQSDLSLALFALFASGGVFALLVATLLPPERPIVWYLAGAVSGIALIIAAVVFLLGSRITVTYAAWISIVYILMLVLLVVRASNLSRATVAGLLIVAVLVFFAWFLPLRHTRLIGYTALGLIGTFILLRFPTNDGILTVVALVLIAVLLTEVFGSFKRNLQRASLVDHLTGVWNRAGFERLLEAQILSRRRTEEPLSVIYLDLDHFKKVNDTLGHRGGDEVLRRVAGGLAEGVRASDSVARVGGDEFVLILPGTSADAARLVAERLQGEVAACAWSYGIAEYRGGESMDEFVDRSDAEMMELKRSRHERR